MQEKPTQGIYAVKVLLWDWNRLCGAKRGIFKLELVLPLCWNSPRAGKETFNSKRDALHIAPCVPPLPILIKLKCLS